jgi:hypothetical protein
VGAGMMATPKVFEELVKVTILVLESQAATC